MVLIRVVVRMDTIWPTIAVTLVTQVLVDVVVVAVVGSAVATVNNRIIIICDQHRKANDRPREVMDLLVRRLDKLPMDEWTITGIPQCLCCLVLMLWAKTTSKRPVSVAHALVAQ
jgi:hypothetical protein